MNKVYHKNVFEKSVITDDAFFAILEVSTIPKPKEKARGKGPKTKTNIPSLPKEAGKLLKEKYKQQLAYRQPETEEESPIEQTTDRAADFAEHRVYKGAAAVKDGLRKERGKGSKRMEESPSQEPPPEPERPPGGEETAHETMETQSDNPTPPAQERAREPFREISDPAEPLPAKRDFSTAPKEKLREQTRTAMEPKEKAGGLPKTEPAEQPPVKRDLSTAPKEKLRERTRTAPKPKEKPGITPKTASTPKERPRVKTAPVRDNRQGTEPPCTPRPVRGDKDIPVLDIGKQRKAVQRSGWQKTGLKWEILRSRNHGSSPAIGRTVPCRGKSGLKR